jgi:hypothetical protein
VSFGCGTTGAGRLRRGSHLTDAVEKGLERAVEY